jgi:hypothetical protein
MDEHADTRKGGIRLELSAWHTFHTYKKMMLCGRKNISSAVTPAYASEQFIKYRYRTNDYV